MFKKVLSLTLCAIMLFSISIPAFASDTAPAQINYKITNPYKDVTAYLGNPDRHYKTNLHTHSTVSDGRITMPEMVKEYYAQNFDILAMSEHGVIGKNWNEQPTHYFLMRICTFFNALSDKQDYFKRQYDILSNEEFKAITEGTYGFDETGKFTINSTEAFSEVSNRRYGRGLNCMTTGIELSAASALQSHLNGYFCDWGECYASLFTNEGNYEFFVKNVEKAGGVTVINHPGHYLNSKHVPENAKDKNQLFYFSDIFNRYESCLGIEVFNNNDNEAKGNRLFWDELLKYVIPYGKRNVYGFSNSDAHNYNQVDTEFMDFILPEYSMDNMRKAMENGEFFATGRKAKNANELGDPFVASGPVPQVTSITVDEENDIITITAKNAKRIEWIADGNLIENSVESCDNGELKSIMKLRDHSNKISTYVRFQIYGDGGYCFSNPFICDDGNMSRFIIEDTRSAAEKLADSADRIFTRNIIGALIKLLEWAIENKLA